MQPLDAHAHLDTNIDTRSLTTLDACVVAVTRSPHEFRAALKRKDASTLWALGLHPGLESNHSPESLRDFMSLFQMALIVGEVGIDGKAGTPISKQAEAFSAVLKARRNTPRILSVHSVGARRNVLDVLAEYGGEGVILHWWQGSAAETREAIELGCSFSVNPAQARNAALLEQLPRDRVLTETDHPFGNRKSGRDSVPGDVTSIESRLAAIWNCDDIAARRTIWQNFRRLAESVGIAESLPRGFLVGMLAS